MQTGFLVYGRSYFVQTNKQFSLFWSNYIVLGEKDRIPIFFMKGPTYWENVRNVK